MMKKIILYVITFIQSIGVFAILTLLIFSNTVLNKQYIVDTLEKCGYYEKTYADIQDGINNYAMQSGLNKEVFENLYSSQKVTQDINNVINAVYDNIELKTSAEEIKQELHNRIYKVLEQHNKTPSSKEIESIKKLEDVIADTYINGIVYSSDIIERIGQGFGNIINIMQKALIATIVVECLLLIVIIIAGRKEALKYMGISFITSGILSVLLQLLVGDRVYHILILNNAFSECVKSIVISILQMFSITGGILIAIGFISCIIANCIYREKG